MKIWLRHHADVAHPTSHERPSAFDVTLDVDELTAGSVDSVSRTMQGCAVCRLRDTLDRERTARWLALRHGNRRGALDPLGVACCPLHAWRMYELAVARGDGHMHAAVAAELLRAAETLRNDLRAARERFGQTGLRDQLMRLRGDVPPGLLWQRPRCPLCEQTRQARQARQSRTSGNINGREPQPYDRADEASGAGDVEAQLYERFARLCAGLSNTQRRVVAEYLCPLDRRRSYHYLRHFAEFPAPVRHHAAGRLPQWWIGPAAGAEDRSFVARLLRDDIPDVECPACRVRAEHEAALIAEVRDAVAADAQGVVPSGEPHGKGTGEVVTSVAGVLDDVCPRHMALLFDAQGASVPLVAPEAGGLRMRYDDACVMCAVVKGWDLARLEGLRRAAGDALLYEDVTQQLRRVLATRRHGLCLPHWQQTTATAERAVTLTLLDLEVRGVSALQASLAEHVGTQQATHSARDDDSDTSDPCVWAAIALAGHPA